ncbi:MAG: hypothetical protein PHT83_04170 [Bacilli bacterium]|nr:hypothetical protein [Bacilli bacterium]
MAIKKYEKPTIQIIKFESEAFCLSTGVSFECTSTPMLCYNQMENLI